MFRGEFSFVLGCVEVGACLIYHLCACRELPAKFHGHPQLSCAVIAFCPTHHKITAFLRSQSFFSFTPFARTRVVVSVILVSLTLMRTPLPPPFHLPVCMYVFAGVCAPALSARVLTRVSASCVRVMYGCCFVLAGVRARVDFPVVVAWSGHVSGSPGHVAI